MMTNEEKPLDSPTDENKTLPTSVTEEKPNVASRSEKTSGTQEPVVHEHNAEQVGGVPNPETRQENNMMTNEEKPLDLPNDQNKTVSTGVTEETLSGLRSSADSQPVEREGNDNQRKENRTMHPILDQNKPAASNSSGPTFDVAQALDALTGMDDSTQVAVNSVFGVLENMISKFEEEKDGENDIKDRNVQEKATDFQSKEQDSNSYLPVMTQQNSGNDSEMESDRLQDPPFHEHNQNSINEQNAASTGWIEDEPTANYILFSGDHVDGYLPNTASNYTTKEEKEMDRQSGSNLLADYADRRVNKVPLAINALPYGDYLHNEYFGQYLLSKMPKTKPLDLDTATALLLDYFPEDGQWKLLEQPRSIGESIADIATSNLANRKAQAHSYAKVDKTDDCIEPPYVVLDTEKQQEPVGNYDAMKIVNENFEDADRSEELMQLVKSVTVDALRVEVGCKLSAANMKEVEVNLDRDLEKVGNAVSLAIACAKDHTWFLQGKEYTMNCALDGDHIVRAISSAVLGTSYLRKVLPVGVIIGSSLAALRKHFNVAPVHGGIKRSEVNDQEEVGIKEIDEKHTSRTNKIISSNGQGMRKGKGTVSNSANNGSVMVGAVTAAIGASALLVQQQDPYKGKETVESSSKTFKEGIHSQKAADMLDETTSEKNQNNIVTSLAEKAMSVAGPVVPTKEDGEVDQERLVAMLADLGQKGGMLKLVGKIALLWGGIRGAMSLTDRLITFLRIAEQPLYQRILGFVGMVLVLWSPVIVPLLPTLVQSWTTGNPSRFAELVCIIGLYAAVLILVALWGKRIRGHENPLAQYGLDLTSPPEAQDFFKGLLGGFLLVLSIQSVNALLGCGSFSWPSSLPSSSSSLGAIKYLSVSGHIIMLAGQGLITAASVALVEELLFRSWLPEEIATDLGYHQGIIISGLAFSLFQRSLLAVPALWLLSLALATFRQRSKGSLSIPIGLRTGLMASSFVLHTGGFLIYNPNAPVWLTGTHPFQPFSGVVGLAFSSILAVSLYRRQSIKTNRKWNRAIRE
uniref:CAAX prenyl protease 2/Lysostaphin resistance protein A-like domain-containing protein n=1 Tax=Rhizophora mucronata TaxID=61149 RepID=A0A2P2MXW8_RHIMU